MKFKYNAVHTEKYTHNGEEKKKYTTIGAVFERDDGSLCMKLLDSWINFYPPKDQAPTQQAPKAQEQLDDEIPY